jgi:hypothetical protein
VGLAEGPAASADGRAVHSPAGSPPRHQVNAGAAAAKQNIDGGAGSTAAAAAKAAADAAREAVWQQIDGAWAAEAVKRGVAHAKAGGY